MLRLGAIIVSSLVFAPFLQSCTNMPAGVKNASSTSDLGERSASSTSNWSRKSAEFRKKYYHSNTFTVRRTYRRKTYTIRGGDNGGQLVRYALRMKRFKRDRTKVRFAGTCSSACTLYLALPRRQTCVSPGSKFRFHKPYGSSRRNNAQASRYLLKSYPRWVRSYIRSKGGLSTRWITMDYHYTKRFMKTCSV